MIRLLIPLALVLAVSASPLAADSRDHKACADAFDACLKECDTKHGTDTAGRAACVPQCSGSYAACDAGVAYDKAKPWFEKKAQETKKFFEDMIEDFKKENPENTAPENKSI